MSSELRSEEKNVSRTDSGRETVILMVADVQSDQPGAEGSTAHLRLHLGLE